MGRVAGSERTIGLQNQGNCWRGESQLCLSLAFALCRKFAIRDTGIFYPSRFLFASFSIANIVCVFLWLDSHRPPEWKSILLSREKRLLASPRNRHITPLPPSHAWMLLKTSFLIPLYGSSLISLIFLRVRIIRKCAYGLRTVIRFFQESKRIKRKHPQIGIWPWHLGNVHARDIQVLRGEKAFGTFPMCMSKNTSCLFLKNLIQTQYKDLLSYNPQSFFYRPVSSDGWPTSISTCPPIFHLDLRNDSISFPNSSSSGKFRCPHGRIISTVVRKGIKPGNPAVILNFDPLVSSYWHRCHDGIWPKLWNKMMD